MKNHLYSLPSQDNYCQEFFGPGNKIILNGKRVEILENIKLFKQSQEKENH